MHPIWASRIYVTLSAAKLHAKCLTLMSLECRQTVGRTRMVSSRLNSACRVALHLCNCGIFLLPLNVLTPNTWCGACRVPILPDMWSMRLVR